MTDETEPNNMDNPIPMNTANYRHWWVVSRRGVEYRSLKESEVYRPGGWTDPDTHTLYFEDQDLFDSEEAALVRAISRVNESLGILQASKESMHHRLMEISK